MIEIVADHKYDNAPAAIFFLRGRRYHTLKYTKTLVIISINNRSFKLFRVQCYTNAAAALVSVCQVMTLMAAQLVGLPAFPGRQLLNRERLLNSL